ncbi:hypothetical protein CL622_01095 [archaeon]|nr:hypothetical protein [archaeon]|tara:strand:- start:1070 stop:1357 length:288 start_codon:yes stop_codon:yes gene_type:complete
MPNNYGYAINDGHGRVKEFLGPYKLIEVGKDEKFVNQQEELFVANPEDFVVLDPKTRDTKLLLINNVYYFGYSIYPFSDGGILYDEPIIKNSRFS